ncbi:LPXTG cell wall anchor domain-containing protein [Bacillus cereus group sp. N24]|uniref:LPXTG cell wall anchor domain-containing protein n=1 Tax=Bacillus cereus group sp. N24 TaxID=2794592 RepID=UPI0018F7720F|nr:LPXTG cell wall anchor domain-containing protein [Bacillus cereus group sp. N24]MBJ7948435.1 LPXTG cell wall anchor domain-containing protein [Bacillus cereus group sp. N24]
MTKIFILASTLSLSFFSGLNIGNAATENFSPTNAIVQNSDHLAEGNSKDNNKPPGSNGSDGSGSGSNGSGGSGSGGSGSGSNGSGGNRVKDDSSSQDGKGSQDGNRVKGDSSSQGGNVKDNATKQGDKLPNTAAHYPASILMGLSTFLIGMLLFIRRKNAR